MAHLKFLVNHQTISRVDDFKPASRSKNYLTAGFTFVTDEWEDKVATAIFRNDEQAFEVLIDENGECLVPWELIDSDQNEFHVSCFAGDLITVNKARVRIYESGYSDDLESETPPTPSVYAQIMDRLQDVETDVDEKATLAESYAVGGTGTRTGEDTDNAKYYSESSSASATAASASATTASGKATEASQSADRAQSAVAPAEAAKNAAISAQGLAESAATSAATSATQAMNAVTNAQTAAAAAKQSEDNAEASADRAWDAVDHNPIIQNNHWYIWNSQTETYVDTNVVAEGEDGVSPIVTVTNIQGGHRITITDASGTHTVDVMDGVDGFSPTVTVVDITGGHRVTITDESGAHSFDVMDGTQITVDSALSDTSENPVQNKVINGAISGLIDDINHKVSDVKINGTSIVDANNEADIPIASANELGVSKVGGSGLNIVNGQIMIARSSSAEIKAGTNGYKPTVPTNQHESVFYGLAKAASDTTQSSSSNPVGTYTDSAKVAIQKMLGIYEAPWELIREDTVTNATEANIEITVDGNGQPFELTDIRMMFTTPQQETTASVGEYGRVRAYYDNYSYDIVYLGAYTQNPNSQQRTGVFAIEQRNGMVQRSMIQTQGNNSSLSLQSRNAYSESAHSTIWEFVGGTRAYNKIVILAVTGTAQYKIFGKRKWQ